MELGLDGKVCVVTAASKGIGYAIAAELLREGAHVVICSRDRERVAQAAAKLEEETGRPVALAIAADVSSLRRFTGCRPRWKTVSTGCTPWC